MNNIDESIRVISWNRDDAADNADAFSWWGGFFGEGMRWKDYLETFDDDVQPYLEAARQSAVHNTIKATGDQHQNGITPVFSDGRYFSLTFRAWGDFMAAVWSEAEEQDYHYMDFYM